MTKVEIRKAVVAVVAELRRRKDVPGVSNHDYFEIAFGVAQEAEREASAAIQRAVKEDGYQITEHD